MSERPVALPPDVPPDPLGGVKIFGVVLVLAGVACAGIFLLVLAAVLLAPMGPGGEGMNPRLVIPSSAIYLVLGAGFVVLGIGSWRVRRWARPLILIVGWSWLIAGILGGVVMVVMVPRVLAPYSGESAAAVTGCTVAALLAMWAVLLAVPIALILYYRRPSVCALFDRRDPGPAWTDRTHPILLGVALLMWVGALASVAGAFVYSALPVFGIMLEGWPLRLLCIALGALSAWIGLAVYRRQPAGFWALVAFQVFGIVNLYTMRGLDDKTLFLGMGYTAAEAEQAAQFGMFDDPVFLGAMAVCWLVLTVLLFGIRKHFVPAATAGSPTPPPV